MNVQLRPLNLGELLDRTFSMYRQNFVLFFGISLVSPALVLVVNVASDLVLGSGKIATLSANNAFGNPAFVLISGAASLIAYIIGSAIAQAAGVKAVSAVYLGQTITLGEAYTELPFGRVLRTMLLVMLVIGSVLVLASIAVSVAVVPLTIFASGNAWAPILAVIAFALGSIVGIIGLVRLLARYALAVPASVIENKGARESMRRSAFLTKGSISKVVTLIVLIFIVGLVIGLVFALPVQIFSLFLTRQVGVTGILLLSHLAKFLSTSLAAPIGTIWIALLYYDERVRKEAFDIEFMMREAGGAGLGDQASAAGTG